MKLLLSLMLIGLSLTTAPCLSAEVAVRNKLQKTINVSLDLIYTDRSYLLSDENKRQKVRETIESNYDLDVIIRRAIGRNWKLMSGLEQQKVLELVKQLVVKAFVNRLDGKSRPNVEFGEVTEVSDKRIEIHSKVILDGQTFHLIYRLGRMSSGWQIYDIVAENISVVSNYRQQIDDHFRKGNAPELINKLEELYKQDEINEDTKI